MSTLERADGTRNIVVVGASAGGVEAITQLVAGLPRNFPAAIFVVLHVPPTGSVLPQILARAGSLDARHAADGDEIRAGCIFVAPPDRHLLLDSEAMRVIRGPKENGHRPAIDPLFRTAAAAHGTHVAAVILSGSLEDGTAGLQAVKRAGGTTIVQDPDEAHYRAMPDSAIRLTSPDYVLQVDEISELLVGAYDGSRPSRRPVERAEQTIEKDSTELDAVALAEANARAGELTSYTCPECNGSLWAVEEGGIVKLRCRVGHTFTEEAYEREKAVALEAALWTAITSLVEKADFSSRFAARMRLGGHDRIAARYEHQAEHSLEQAERLRKALMELGVTVAEEAARVT